MRTALTRPGSTSRRSAVRASALLAAVALTGVLAGCSGSSSSDGAASNTVSFLSWDNTPVMQPVIDAFEKANPGYKVEFSYAQPVAGYIQKLQTELSSNTAQDVFIITAENKTQIMDGGFAKDLSGEPWISNLADAAKATYTKDGKVYGAATASWGGGILANTDLLAKVGYTGAPKTWQEFLDLCTKLKNAGITPFYEGSDGIPVTLAALLGLQNKAMNGQMDADIWAGTTTFAKTWTPALTTWQQLFGKGVEAKTVAGLTGDQVTQQFEQGKVAMIGTGSWALGGIQKAAPNLKVTYLPVPSADGQQYWAGAVAPGYAINSKAKNTAAAEKFVQFLQSKEGVQIYQQQTGSITTTKDFSPVLDASLTTMSTAVRNGDFYLPAVSWPTHSDQLSTQAVALMQQMILGTITPDAFAAGMDTKLASVK